MSEEILKPLRLIYSQNQEILKLLHLLTLPKLEMLDSIIKAKEETNRELEKLAKQFGSKIIN